MSFFGQTPEYQIRNLEYLIIFFFYWTFSDRQTNRSIYWILNPGLQFHSRNDTFSFQGLQMSLKWFWMNVVVFDLSHKGVK